MCRSKKCAVCFKKDVRKEKLHSRRLVCRLDVMSRGYEHSRRVGCKWSAASQIVVACFASNECDCRHKSNNYDSPSSTIILHTAIRNVQQYDNGRCKTDRKSQDARPRPFARERRRAKRGGIRRNNRVRAVSSNC